MEGRRVSGHVSWLVGGRDGEYAMAFKDDLRSRLANRVQLTTDGHKAYLQAVEGVFGNDVDYAVLHKVYGAAPESAKGKYSPAECIGTQKHRITGEPEMKRVSTSFIECSNLTMRMHNRRFTRLTNAFSKKFESHVHMVAIWSVWYNFIRIHKSLRMTPAMAANLTTTVWTWEPLLPRWMKLRQRLNGLRIMKSATKRFQTDTLPKISILQNLRILQTSQKEGLQ